MMAKNIYLPGIELVKDSDHKKVGIKKPTWMPTGQWRELLALHDGIPQCAYTKKTAHEVKLVVDHIVPRSKDGPNEVSNYQFLCEEENLKKWAKPDKYWAQNFYYDRHHDPNKFRYAQDSLAYRQILAYAQHFQRPWSQINRIVHLLAWITGAGKTMAIHAICFALNQILRKDKGLAYPRVDRILVLVKEQSLRDQLQKELAEDVVNYQICSIAPRVAVVEKSSQLENDYWLEQHDIVVSCLQQVWEREKGIPRDKIEPILGKFAVIFLDEPHFAVEQVAELAELATRSLCFGLTSTPINAKGKILESYVLFSLLGYLDASREQKNLKYLSSSEGAIEQSKLIETVDRVEAREFFGGKRTEIEGSPDTEGYNIQLEPAKTVAEKVVSYVVESDRFCKQVFLGEITPQPAPHRNENEVMADLIYPMHAMISVKTKLDAEVLTEHLNNLFRSDPQEYPQHQGFGAEFVYSGGEDEHGKTVKGYKLHTKHPWLKCWRSKNFQMSKSGWKLPDKCARFLIVVDMAREGINNPFCGVVGLGRRNQSIIEVIQRLIGRQIRSYIEQFFDKLRVPPAQLDTIKIWTHDAWNFPQAGNDRDYATKNRILDGLNFCEYMDEWLADLTTLEDLIEEKGKELDGLAETTDRTPLKSQEKLGIAFDIGTYQLKDEAIDEDNIMNRWCGDMAEKRKLGKQWLDLVKNEPKTARTELGLNMGKLHKRHIIEHERPQSNPSVEDLRWYYQIHNPKSLAALDMLDDPALDSIIKESLRSTFEDNYNLYMKGLHRLSDLPKVTDFKKIRNKLVNKLYSQVGYNPYSNEMGLLQADKKEIKKMAYSQIGFAVKTVLGLEKAEKGSEHDTPQYHAVLLDRSVVRDILGYARKKLLQKFSQPIVRSLQIVDLEKDGE